MLTGKQAVLYRDLKQRVTTLPSGERLPSVRQLMRDYGVGQISVEKALRQLKSEVPLVSLPGEGTYKAEDAAPERSPVPGVIELLVHDATSPFVAELARVMGAAAATAGHGFRVGRYAWEQFPRPLPLGRDVAALLVCRAMALDAETFASLQALRVPVVLLDTIPSGTPFDGVGTANDFGGALAADHLIRAGHRRLAVLRSEPETFPNGSARVQGFLRQAQLAGFEVPAVIHRHPEARHGSVAIAYDTLARVLAAGRPAFTGLFVDSDSGALGALRACHDAGLAIPGDLAVVGFDDLPESAFTHPSLTTLRQDLPEWARQALEIVRRRLAGEKGAPIQVSVAPQLIVRESTGGPSPHSERKAQP